MHSEQCNNPFGIQTERENEILEIRGYRWHCKKVFISPEFIGYMRLTKTHLKLTIIGIIIAAWIAFIGDQMHKM